MNPRVDVVIPTRNRSSALAQTLDALADHSDIANVFIIDNASDRPVDVPTRLPNGARVQCIRLDHNAGAAARNIAANTSEADWLLMLDDDSAPLAPWDAVLRHASEDVAAIGADITLPSGAREAGGLPEVFVGCGALVRRQAFLSVGGYDASFGFYGEETDLCARLIDAGHRIVFDPALRVEHRRATEGRDVAVIVERLACNEARTIHRYAPDDERESWIDLTLQRRCAIAEREGCLDAFESGRDAFLDRAQETERRTLSKPHWDRLVGRALVRCALRQIDAPRVAIEMPSGPPGKHAHVISEELAQPQHETADSARADVIVAGTLAPGLAIEAAERLKQMYPHARAIALSPLARAGTRDG